MAGERKRMKAELKAYPMSEMSKEAREFISASASLKKKFSIISYSETLELDSRKWNPKSLTDGLNTVVRFDLKALATAVAQALKKDGKKAEKSIDKVYDRMSKIIVKKAADALDEIKGDDGDNKKALKEGKGAFADIDRIKWKAMFADPRKTLATEMVKLNKALRLAEGDDKKAKKACADAFKPIAQANATFERVLKEAKDAGESVVKLANETRKNDDVAPELVNFAKMLLKGQKLFDDLEIEAKRMSELLADVETGLKAGDAKVEDVNKWLSANAKLGGGEKAASTASGWGKQMKQKFLIISKKLN
jgi:hypothetical protein